LTLPGLPVSFGALPELSIAMTDTHSTQRQANTPYAALHAASDGDAAKAQRGASSGAAPVEPDVLAAEADRLESLKQALYSAFLAAPTAGIPTALVDLAATYTSALRLQLTLKGLGNVPARSFKAPTFNAGRGRSA
jgi:hypothetical protein